MRFVSFLHTLIGLCLLHSTIIKIPIASCLKGVANHEYDLYNKLFKDYTTSIRPVQNWNDRLDVFVKVQLNKVARVIEDHQTMRLYVRMEVTWTDINLKWNPSEFNKIESILLPASNVWVPDLHLFNSASEDDLIYPMNIEVFFNGTVKSSPLTNLYAHCNFNFRYFPYDSQSCEFIIGTMIDKINVDVHAFTNEFEPNSEWELTSMTHGETHSFLIPGTTHAINEAFSYNWMASKFSVTIKRDANFYVHLFIWPLIFVLYLGTCIFILPTSCVERVTMGVLLILTLVICSLMLESFTPKSADPSIVGKLIAFDMFMITLATVISTLIISIDKENFLMIKKIPRWLINLMLGNMGKVAFKHETLRRVFDGELIRSEDEEEMKIIDTNQIVEEISEQPTSSSADEHTPETVSEQKQTEILLALINNQIAKYCVKLKENDLRETNKREWCLIAIVLDRLCLIGYTIIASFGLFVILI